MKSNNILTLSRSDLVDQYNIQEKAMTIRDIVKQIPLKDITSIDQFGIKDQEWLSKNSNPTAFELYRQYLKENEIIPTGLEDYHDVWYDVVNVDDIWIDDAGQQRNQWKDSETQSNIISRANMFRFTKALIWLGYVDIPEDPDHGKYFAMDGGGTLMSAALRNIQKIGAIIVRITDKKQLGDNFYDLANSRASVRGEHRWMRQLVLGEPYAMLQHRVFQDSNTTPLYNSDRQGNKSLKHFSLQAQNRLLKWKFVNTEDTSISGDSADTINDIDLCGTREATNIVETCNAISFIYRQETKLIPAFVKELCRWYAATNSLVNYDDMVQMLEDLKNEKIVIFNKENQANKSVYRIHPNCVTGQIDFSTQQHVVDSLRLQDHTETYAMYGVLVFSKIWNIWCKHSGCPKIQDAWIEEYCSLEEGKSEMYHYNPKTNYKAKITEAKNFKKFL